MSTTKPNFLIIGAPRCGTTYLARNLATHPDIFLSTGDNDDIAGDVHYFDANTEEGSRNLAKGPDWYFGLFSATRNAQAIGEKTADYLADPDAPALIANTLDHPRIIVMIRDPVERAWSHFCHSRHRLPPHLKFGDLVTHGNATTEVPVLSAGLYARQLQRYIAHFGSENILVLVKEDLDLAPETALARTCSFLGVNAEYHFPHIDTYVNAGSSGRLATAAARTGKFIKTRFPRVYRALVRGPFSGPIAFLIQVLRGKAERHHAGTSRSAHEVLDSGTRDALRNYYRSDVEEMSRYIERDLASLWWEDDPDTG